MNNDIAIIYYSKFNFTISQIISFKDSFYVFQILLSVFYYLAASIFAIIFKRTEPNIIFDRNRPLRKCIVISSVIVSEIRAIIHNCSIEMLTDIL